MAALIRQLVVSWLLARTPAASYQRDHTVLVPANPRSLSSRCNAKRMDGYWPRVPIPKEFDDLFNYFDGLVSVDPDASEIGRHAGRWLVLVGAGKKGDLYSMITQEISLSGLVKIEFAKILT